MSPPVHIGTCIVCEQARPEILEKWTLLGFFGVTPNVWVRISDFTKPVTLCFVFVGGECVGKLHVAIRVVAPSGANIPGGSEAIGEFVPEKKMSAFYMAFQGVMPGPGRYSVVMVLNGQDVYQTTFELLPLT